MHRLPYPKSVELECPLCLATHTCPVDRDENGAYAPLETQNCNHDECTKKICSCCPQFSCSCCGLTFCLEADHIGHEEEPECTCEMSGDQADARGCALHGSNPVKVHYYCRVCAAPEVVEERMEPVTAGFPEMAEVA